MADPRKVWKSEISILSVQTLRKSPRFMSFRWELSKNRNVAETVLSELEKDGYSGFITTKDAR